MAAVERDGADDGSSTEDNQPRAMRNLSTARSDKPLFTTIHNRERNRERITFEKRDRGEDENVEPGPKTGSNRNWMSGQQGMKLGEAFQRADADGNFLPRLSARMAESNSRIPRTKSFSTSSSPSPSQGARDVDNIQGRSLSAPLDSESDNTGLYQGSPSPAARNRRQKRENRRSDVSQNSPGRYVKPSEADRRPRNYAEDQERLEQLRGLHSPPLFSRAPVGPKVEEAARTLVEKTSASSFENEPPVRAPKTWGSKAKKNSGWITKILSPDTSMEINDLPKDVSSGKQREAADVPLPSVEDLSAVHTLTPPASRPASARPTNISPEKSQMWNADYDFTAQSLQISTSPQLRVKPTKLDEIREREIQSVTARAVATNRLEEIREKNSEERSFGEDIARAGLNDVQELAGAEEGLSILERNGYHESDSPVHAHNSRTTREKTSNEDHDETRETLRALSRVLTSKSPSPPRMDEKEVNQRAIVDPSTEEKFVERQTRRDMTSRGTLDANAGFKRNSGASTPPKSDVDPEERITAEARLFELQDTKSERNSLRVPSRTPSPSPSDDEKFDETPRPPKIDPMLLPTPRVTGAFIETPAQSVRRPRKSRSIPPAPKEEGGVASERASSERRGSGRPASDTSVPVGNARRRERQPQSAVSRQSRPRPLINSARPSTVAEDLQRIKLEAQLEDSTMEDFDAFLEAHARTTGDPENNTTILEPVVDLEYDERGQPLSAKEIARRVELLTLDRMYQSIKNTSSSIRDARHGIERLEQKVSSSSLSTKGEYNAASGPNYIMIPIPRFITYNNTSSGTPTEGGVGGKEKKKEKKKWRNWKFTWFGFITTTLVAWFFSELFMCNEFCHSNQSFNPRRDSRDDPFFPLAIPTKLDQWTGEIASTLFWDVWIALGGERPSIFGDPKPCDWCVGGGRPAGIVRDRESSSSSSYGGYEEGKSIFSDEMI